MRTLQTEMDNLYNKQDQFYAGRSQIEQAMNTMNQEAYLSDLKDTADYRKLFYSRVTQVLANENKNLKKAEAGSDDEAVIKTVIAWMTERQVEQKEMYDEANKMF